MVLGAACYLAACAGAAATVVNPCGDPTDPGDRNCLNPPSYQAQAYAAVTQASVSAQLGGHALRFANAARFGAGQFIFESGIGRDAADGATFSQTQWFQPSGWPTDGFGTFSKSGGTDTATLTGVLVAGRQLVPGRFGNHSGAVQLADYAKRFSVRLSFAYRGDGLGNDGAGGPLLELDSDAYVDGGGVIDPNNWSYFDLKRGDLVGEGDYAGLVLSLYQIGGPFQSGTGANGRNTDLGLSGGFGYVITQLETGKSRFLADLALKQKLFVGWSSKTEGGGEQGAFNIDWDVVPVPEPAGLGLLALGAAALAAGRRVRPGGARAGC
jgi:hypothetical protein